MKKNMKFTVKTTINFDIEKVASYLAENLDGYIEDEYYNNEEVVESICNHSNEILKNVAEYWLENLK